MKLLGMPLPVLVALLALIQPAFGQPATAIAAGELTAAVATAQRQYTASFAAHPQLFNGPEYLDYAKPYHKRTGHQFFAVPEKQPGSVHYNGHLFAGLLLAYDVVLDQVVLSPPSSPLTLRLINENVRAFDLNGHHFIRLVADSSTGKTMRTGYYEVLFDSTVQVLAKRTKRLQEQVAQSVINVEFIAKDELFFKKNGIYSPVSRKSAMRLFADRNKEMQDYLKAQKLSFKKAQLEATVVQLASYYCSLSAR